LYPVADGCIHFDATGARYPSCLRRMWATLGWSSGLNVFFQTLGAAHGRPVVLELSGAQETHLVVLAISGATWPGKLVRTMAQEEHIQQLLRHKVWPNWQA